VILLLQPDVPELLLDGVEPRLEALVDLGELATKEVDELLVFRTSAWSSVQKKTHDLTVRWRGATASSEPWCGRSGLQSPPAGRILSSSGVP